MMHISYMTRVTPTGVLLWYRSVSIVHGTLEHIGDEEWEVTDWIRVTSSLEKQYAVQSGCREPVCQH
jgi:hypothetical protein